MRRLTVLFCVLVLAALAPVAVASGPDASGEGMGIGSMLGGFWEYLVATVLAIVPTGDPLGFEEGLPTGDPSGPSQEAFPYPEPIGFETQEAFPYPDPIGFEIERPANEPSGPLQEAFPIPDPIGFEIERPAHEPSGPPQEAFPTPDPLG